MLKVLALAFVLACVAPGNEAINQLRRIEIINTGNNFRRKQGASDMKYLVRSYKKFCFQFFSFDRILIFNLMFITSIPSNFCSKSLTHTDMEFEARTLGRRLEQEMHIRVRLGHHQGQDTLPTHRCVSSNDGNFSKTSLIIVLKQTKAHSSFLSQAS